MIGVLWMNFELKKSVEDKKQVFGWANVAEDEQGNTIEDYQGDSMTSEELEKTAYNYVLKFRDTGERHNPTLRKKGKMIESIVFTKEKLQVLGLPEDSLPCGWWVGFQITDNDTWEKIKKGEYNMFSIEGTAQVENVNKAIQAKSFLECYT